jgi:hypothetical protein
LLLGLAPDAPQRGDGLRVQERHGVGERHDEQPVRFGAAGGELGDVFGRGGADGRAQSGLAVDPLAQSRADLPGGAEQLQGARDIQERLVDRKRLDQRRDLSEELHHLRGVVRVPLEVRLEDDGLGATAQRDGHRHRRIHAIFAGLVGGGGDDRPQRPVTDDDRLADQLRMLEQLDGREERVHVHVQDVGGRVAGRRLGDLPATPILLAHPPILTPRPHLGHGVRT